MSGAERKEDDVLLRQIGMLKDAKDKPAAGAFGKSCWELRGEVKQMLDKAESILGLADVLAVAGSKVGTPGSCASRVRKRS